MQKKLGVLRLEGWGNPTTTGTGVANPDNPKYEGYVPLPGEEPSRKAQRCGDIDVFEWLL